MMMMMIANESARNQQIIRIMTTLRLTVLLLCINSRQAQLLLNPEIQLEILMKPHLTKMADKSDIMGSQKLHKGTCPVLASAIL